MITRKQFEEAHRLIENYKQQKKDELTEVCNLNMKHEKLNDYSAHIYNYLHYPYTGQRVKNFLRGFDITLYEFVLKYSKKDLLCMPRVGIAMVRKIDEICNIAGLKLRER